MELDILQYYAKKPYFVSHTSLLEDLNFVLNAPEKPSEIFKLLDQHNILEQYFAPLHALKAVPAGPAQYHHDDTAYGHTLKTLDRVKSNNLTPKIFLCLLCHDFGKATTPSELLPKHHGHDRRSKAIADEWLKTQIISQEVKNFVLNFAEQHMRVHRIHEAKPYKVLKLYEVFGEKNWNNYVYGCHCDHPFKEDELLTLLEIDASIKEVNAKLESKTFNNADHKLSEKIHCFNHIRNRR